VSGLTDFLHRLVDKAGISELHTEIDELDKPAETTDGGEDSPDAEE
jgi:hypothetical protein